MWEIERLIASVVAESRVREQMFTIDWHFACAHGLSSVAFDEVADADLLDAAYPTIEGGIALAQAVGSPGTVRHGQMILLCWVATFGPDPALDALLADPRAIADNAISGAWVPHDRATLGVLFYRGAELLRTKCCGSA